MKIKITPYRVDREQHVYFYGMYQAALQAMGLIYFVSDESFITPTKIYLCQTDFHLVEKLAAERDNVSLILSEEKVVDSWIDAEKYSPSLVGMRISPSVIVNHKGKKMAVQQVLNSMNENQFIKISSV